MLSCHLAFITLQYKHKSGPQQLLGLYRVSKNSSDESSPLNPLSEKDKIKFQLSTLVIVDTAMGSSIKCHRF